MWLKRNEDLRVVSMGHRHYRGPCSQKVKVLNDFLVYEKCAYMIPFTWINKYTNLAHLQSFQIVQKTPWRIFCKAAFISTPLFLRHCKKETLLQMLCCRVWEYALHLKCQRASLSFITLLHITNCGRTEKGLGITNKVSVQLIRFRNAGGCVLVTEPANMKERKLRHIRQVWQELADQRRKAGEVFRLIFISCNSVCRFNMMWVRTDTGVW